MCYGREITFSEDELFSMNLNEKELKDESQRGIESDDEEDVFGVEGMTVQLLELITTIVVKPGTHELIKMGLLPLVSTISSYLLLTQEQVFIKLKILGTLVHQ